MKKVFELGPSLSLVPGPRVATKAIHSTGVGCGGKSWLRLLANLAGRCACVMEDIADEATGGVERIGCFWEERPEVVEDVGVDGVELQLRLNTVVAGAVGYLLRLAAQDVSRPDLDQ